MDVDLETEVEVCLETEVEVFRESEEEVCLNPEVDVCLNQEVDVCPESEVEVFPESEVEVCLEKSLGKYLGYVICKNLGCPDGLQRKLSRFHFGSPPAGSPLPLRSIRPEYETLRLTGRLCCLG